MTSPHPRTVCAGRDLRILRAAVFAAVCVVLAAVGHTLASCAAVPLWALGVAFLGTLVVVAPLTGRARSLPGITTLLTAGQTVLHILFGLSQGGPDDMPPRPMGSTSPTAVMPDAELMQHAARYVHGTTAAAIGPDWAYRALVDAPASHGGMDMSIMHHPADALATTGAAALLPSLSMLLAHVLAAVAAGWLLRHGDLALLRLIDLSTHGAAERALVRSLRAALALMRALCAGLPTAPDTAPRSWRTADSAPLILHTTALQHTMIRRGPPAAALVLAA